MRLWENGGWECREDGGQVPLDPPNPLSLDAYTASDRRVLIDDLLPLLTPIEWLALLRWLRVIR